MPGDYQSGGDAREAAWLDAHPDQVVDGSSRPGYVYMGPHNQFGAPPGWISVDEYNRKYKTGWTLKQMLAMATPFIASGVGSLAGPGGAAAGNTAGALPSTSFAGSATLPVAAGAGNLAGAGAAAGHIGAAAAAGTAAKGAGMAFGIKDAVQLAPLIASLFSKGGGNGQPPQQDAMQGLINMQTNRLQQSDPLYQAVLKMAMGLMPTAYQSGMTGLPTAAPSAPAIPRRR
jgi:hypothetical protein